MLKRNAKLIKFSTVAIFSLLVTACSEHEISNKPPAVPSEPTPSNGATGVSRNADLRWKACADPDGDDVTYDVYFGKTQPPPRVKQGQSNDNYDPGLMDANKKYFWKIVASDNNGNSSEGPIWYFTTGESTNHPPNPPGTPNPANNTTDVDINADLSWTCNDPDGDALVFDIYFGTGENPPLVKNNHGAANYDPGAMGYITKYYWKVVAKDNHNNETPGPIWSFTTRGHGVFLGKWGYPGSGNGEFNHPVGITTASNGNVYVVDSDNHRVQYFSSNGSFLGKWGSPGSGDGQFLWPYGVAVAANGNIYVSDVGNDRVEYFTAEGGFLGKWGSYGSGNGQFLGPHGIAIAPNGNVYVAEIDNDRVQYFTPSGSYLGKWGCTGSGNGEFNHPTSIATTPNGNIYVGDVDNYRIQYFTSGGSFLGKWGSYGSGNGQFKGAGPVAALNGVVYVIDSGNNRVQYFSDYGNFLGKWGSLGQGNGQFDGPAGAAVTSEGVYIYVTDYNNHRVQYFR